MADTTLVRQPFVLVPEHSFEEKWELAQKRYKRTIKTFARNCVNQLPGYDQADVEQELLVVLWKCVINYDPDKGASFNTLFQGSARNRCITLVRTASTKSRTGINVSLDVDAVAAAVDEAFQEQSTEDRCMFREEVRELVSQYGADAIMNGVRGRPRTRRVA
jgi:DNA-directed RNA polymerase specialized sigma24 family protein